jgi:hypothetical protein
MTVVSNVCVSLCRSFLILRLLYRFPILLDAAAEVIKRKGDAFVGAWATVLLPTHCCSPVRGARSELGSPGHDGRPEQDMVLLSYLVRVRSHAPHARRTRTQQDSPCKKMPALSQSRCRPSCCSGDNCAMASSPHQAHKDHQLSLIGFFRLARLAPSFFASFVFFLSREGRTPALSHNRGGNAHSRPQMCLLFNGPL